MVDDLPEWGERAKVIADVARAVDAPGLFRRLFDAALNKPPGESGPVSAPDWRSEALQALRDNAVDKLANIPLTVEQAIRILEPDFDWGNLVEPNQTWSSHWLSAASKVGADDQERRTWWARLLAGEIQQPGTYSLRTIGIMDVLSPSEAELFSRLCGYVWVGTARPHPLILPRESSTLWRPDVSESLTLQAAGLIARQAQGFSWPMIAGERYRLNLGSTQVEISVNRNGSFRVGPLLLTEAGEQIWGLVDPRFQHGYLDEMLEEWRTNGDVSVHPLV